MKLIEITGTAILALVLGIAGPVYARQEQQNEKQDHPEQQQGKQEPAKPEQQHAQQQEKQNEHHVQQEQKQNQEKQQEQHAQQQQRQNQEKQQEQHAQQQQQQNQEKQQQQHAQQQQSEQNQHQSQQTQRHSSEPQRTQEQQRVEQSAWQEHRAHSWQSDHRDWEQRGGYRGYRVPDDRYRGYFGQEHGFRIYGLPFLVVGGYPRFQYQGYWLSPVDPWPEYWASDWYDTDDVYVVYVNNGYYLFNQRYPNVGIAVNISM